MITRFLIQLINITRQKNKVFSSIAFGIRRFYFYPFYRNGIGWGPNRITGSDVFREGKTSCNNTSLQ